jgi:hypothetical protein
MIFEVPRSFWKTEEPWGFLDVGLVIFQTWKYNNYDSCGKRFGNQGTEKNKLIRDMGG